MTPELIRDLIYDGEDEILLQMHRTFDNARIKGYQVDCALLDIIKAHLTKYIPEWCISGKFADVDAYWMSYRSIADYASLSERAMALVGRFVCNSFDHLIDMYISKGEAHIKFDGLDFMDKSKIGASLVVKTNGRLTIYLGGYHDLNHTYGGGIIFNFDNNTLIVRGHSRAFVASNIEIVARGLRGTAYLMGEPEFFEQFINEDGTIDYIQE